MRYAQNAQFAAVTWTDGRVSYVLSGPSDRTRLISLARKTYDQIEQKTAPAAG
jgi:anti-sigma factor RsiW